MINKQAEEIISLMRGKPEATAVQEYVKERIYELSNFRNIEGTIEEKGRIVEARQEAIKILEGVIRFLDTPKKPIEKTKYN